MLVSSPGHVKGAQDELHILPKQAPWMNKEKRRFPD
jgi:hypothetical protein